MHYPGTNSVIHSIDEMVDINHSYRTDFDESPKCNRREKEMARDEEFRFKDVDALPNPPREINKKRQEQTGSDQRVRKRKKRVRFSPVQEYTQPQWGSTAGAQASVKVNPVPVPVPVS